MIYDLPSVRVFDYDILGRKEKREKKRGGKHGNSKACHF